MTNSIIYNELLEMLNNIPLDDYLKIPYETIHLIESRVDLDKKSISNKYSKEAYIIFLKLYMTYIASNDENKKIKELIKLNDLQTEKNKQKIYNSNIVFYKQTYQKQDELIITHKKWYKSILKIIKKFLIRK